MASERLSGVAPKPRMGRPTLFRDKTARLSGLRITAVMSAKVKRTAELMGGVSETDALEALVRAAPSPAIVARAHRADELQKPKKS